VCLVCMWVRVYVFLLFFPSDLCTSVDVLGWLWLRLGLGLGLTVLWPACAVLRTPVGTSWLPGHLAGGIGACAGPLCSAVWDAWPSRVLGSGIGVLGDSASRMLAKQLLCRPMVSGHPYPQLCCMCLLLV